MCDTFVALGSRTKDGSVILGKNSDREPNEMQALEYHPRRQYPDGVQVNCTYLHIPQARETNAVLLGRPFWMWGAEFGVNEYGLAIGNEAVWTKMPLLKKSGLTGMDLLRLALERAATARQGIEVIISLLADHGQGGICGLYDKSMTYHNSYLLADPREAWVLETAGQIWAARTVKDYYAISNGLTIGEDYEMIHEQAITYARRRGWLKKGRAFHFAACYSDWLYTTFSAQQKRRFMADCFLRDHSDMDVPKAIELLQSHPRDAYHPDRPLLGDSICAHAGNSLTRNATQTTGSMVCRLSPTASRHWFTATSSPCLSVFKPLTFQSEQPVLGPATATFHPDAFWWRHERLYRDVLRDFPNREAIFAAERETFQTQLIKDAEALGADHLSDISRSSFDRHRQLVAQWTAAVSETPVMRKPSLVFRNYWGKMNRRAGVDLGKGLLRSERS